MHPPELHRFEVTLVADQRTVRYWCRSCGRCLEDRPDGLVLLSRGDPDAAHHGGSLSQADVEVAPLGAAPRAH